MNADALRAWVRDGPRADDSTLAFFLGFWVWWRTWATIVLVGAGLAAALWVSTVANPRLTTFVAFFLGALVNGWLDRAGWGGDE